MRAERHDVTPIPHAEGDTLVMCTVHSSRRLAKFCVHKPVYNADRVVIDYTYECKDGSQCASSASRTSFPKQGPHREDALLESSTPAGAAAVAPEEEVKTTAATRGTNRYYDLTSQRNSGATGVKKVCWSCGMEGHEKPDCPNALCKTCHTIRGRHHLCQEPRPSPFLNLSPILPLLKDMSSVRCVVCSLLGHFDCSTRREYRVPSCCFCAEKGHSAYDCRRRKEQVPDRWVNRSKEGEYSVDQRRDFGASTTQPPGYYPTSYGSMNSARNYNQRPAWEDSRGDFSHGDNWNADMRENGFQAKDGNSGRYYSTGSCPQYDNRRSQPGYNDNRRNSSYAGEMDHRSRHGNKRARYNDDDDSYQRYAQQQQHHHHNHNHNQHRHWSSNHNHDKYAWKNRRRYHGRDGTDDDHDDLF